MISKLLAEMVERGMLARQGRRHILLRGAGLDAAPRGAAASAPESEGGGTPRRAAGDGADPRRAPVPRRGAAPFAVIGR